MKILRPGETEVIIYQIYGNIDTKSHIGKGIHYKMESEPFLDDIIFLFRHIMEVLSSSSNSAS